jgi:hypothetical protein
MGEESFIESCVGSSWRVLHQAVETAAIARASGVGRRASGMKGVESRVSGIKNVLTDSRRLLYCIQNLPAQVTKPLLVSYLRCNNICR